MRVILKSFLCSLFFVKSVYISVAQIQPPLISGSSSVICNNEAVTLIASGCNGGIVNWSNSMIGDTISVNVSGSYTATCTINNVVSANSQPFVIFSNSSGSLSLIGENDCSNTSLKLLPSNLPNDTYPKFSRNNLSLDLINAVSYNPSQGGNYFFTAVDKTQGVWNSQNSSTTQKINDIFFINANKGWAIGTGGRVSYTVNGGQTWNSIIAASNVEFKSVFFVNETTGWTVGTNGKILKTTNGGISWFSQTISGLGNTNIINAVHFSDINNGWVVVSNGTYYKTIDGGSTWTRQQYTSNTSLIDVFFINNSIGWVLTSGLVYFKTSDSGNSWEILSVPYSSGSLNDIFFTDINNGWVVGSNGFISRTNDGGKTWKVQISNTSTNLKKVKFLSKLEGWVVGESGAILYTFDGGNTWIKQSINSINNYNGLYFIDNQNGWIAGDNGEIKKFFRTKKEYCPSNTIFIKQSPPQLKILRNNCNGTNVELISSECQGGIIWSNGSTSSSITVSTTAVYTVKCLINGCESIESKEEKVNIGSNVILQAENGNTCLPQNPVLSVAGLSANMLVEWQKNQIPFDNTNNSFSPTEAGEYDVIPYTKGDKNWEWLNTEVPVNSLFATTMVNKNIAWAVGKFGTIANTIDGGITWTAKQFDYDFYDIRFVDQQNGFIAAYKSSRNYIFKTTDGGKNWQIIDLNISYQSIESLFFLNKYVGWVVGTNRTIMKTVDGGLNWFQQYTDNISPMHLNSIFFINDSKGWATGSRGLIIYTTDGGNSWNTQTSNVNYSLIDVHFINENKGLVVGEGGTILTTNNGGLNWTLNLQMQSIYNSVYSKCQFLDPLNAYIFSGGNIVRTIDGGDTWSFQPISVVGAHKIGGFFLDYQHGIVVGNYGEIITTHDGGLNWNDNYNVVSDLKKVYFANKNNGWILGYKSVGRTVDGGKNWSFQTLNTPDQLANIFFINDKIGWITNKLKIFKTIDGGITWNEQLINVDLNTSFVDGIFFTNENNGWLVGTSDLVLKTTDGGSTWTKVEIYNPNFERRTFKDIFFVNPNKGWIIGPKGLMYLTENGGQTWTYRTPQTTNDLSKPFFIDENTGWIVASTELLRTIDGGMTWQKTTFGLNYFSEVHFVNKNKGWAITGTQLSVSNDGGASWEIIRNVTNNNISLFALNEEEVITVGARQAILKYGYTLTKYCPTNVVLINTPNPPVVNTRSNILCQNQSLKISSTGCGGIVLWNNGLSGEEITITSPGSYSAKCIINNCESISSNIIEIILSNTCNQINITPKSVYVCPNKLTTLTASGCTSNNILWSNNMTGTSIVVTMSTSSMIEAFCQEGGSKSIQINVAQENLVIDSNIQDGEHYFQVNNTIQSNSKIILTNPILGETKVKFISGKSIILNPGFEAKTQTFFYAQIKSCLE